MSSNLKPKTSMLTRSQKHLSLTVKVQFAQISLRTPGFEYGANHLKQEFSAFSKKL